MPRTANPSLGSQLLAEWRGELKQNKACELLDLDTATYNRFEHGIRKPSAEIAARIEKLTNGRVTALSWYDPPRERKAKAS